MHSIWSGSLHFGLVNIPVNIYSAAEEREFSFTLLHRKDNSPIRYARICKEEDKEIPYKEIVKGYEFTKGEYVVIEEEEFKKVRPEKSNTIDVISFAKETEIDPIYFDRPYYLAPGKGASKSYALLREALLKSGKVGVARYVFHNKEHIAIIKPHSDVILLNQLRYSNEIREYDDLNLPKKGESSKKELDLALVLINQLTESFDITAFKDTYSEDLKEMIEAKSKGKPGVKKAVVAAKEPKFVDLLSQLRASIDKSQEKKEEKKKTAAKPRVVKTKKTHA